MSAARARSRWKPRALHWARRVGFHTPLRRLLFHRYDYMFAPAQLCFLCGCLDRTRELDGICLEIGCAWGHTTVFLNKHMDFAGIDRDYLCIDTFSGFTAADAAAERARDGSRAGRLTGFRRNRRQWFERTLLDNGVRRVRTVRGDVTALALDDLPPVAFCLIDVDLYRPVLSALEKVYPRLVPGGVIVVDDCDQGGPFEGARHAYLEFAAGIAVEPELRLGKLGVLHRSGDDV